MSDFGADTSDFDSDFRAGLSDYASDFRAESNDYASDFCDFPGDSDRDFGSEARHSSHRTAGMEGPEPADAETAPSIRPQGRKGGGKLAAQAASHGAGETPRHKAINKAHSARVAVGI